MLPAPATSLVSKQARKIPGKSLMQHQHQHQHQHQMVQEQEQELLQDQPLAGIMQTRTQGQMHNTLQRAGQCTYSRQRSRFCSCAGANCFRFQVRCGTVLQRGRTGKGRRRRLFFEWEAEAEAVL